MERLTKIVCALAAAYFLCGFAHSQYVAYSTHYETKEFVKVFHSGDTVDSILIKYHNADNEGVDFDEWKFNILHLDENRHLLDKNGYLKTYYPGQELHIRIKTRVAK